MNLVSLLVLPAVITLRHNGVRYAIAAVALVVLLAAIAFSKRRSEGVAGGSEPVTPEAVPAISSD